MTTELEVPAPTNQAVAERLHLTHSGVSRIRSGDRLPSVPVMQLVETEYDWPVAEQVWARGEGTYAQAFEQAIRTPVEHFKQRPETD